jgi:hypothetical protein
VPIIERKPEEAFKRFHRHINRLITSTIRVEPPVRLAWTSKGDRTIASLEFVRGDGIATPLPLETRFGRLYLTLLQIMEAEPELRKFRLKTKEYSYRLLDSADPRSNAVLRWEYVSDAAPDGFCRHHVQVNTGVGFSGGLLDMNRAHAPSGWVTIEELLRFLIVDLGVVPVTRSWAQVLADSERRFYEEFTSKRYRAPAFRVLPGGKG